MTPFDSPTILRCREVAQMLKISITTLAKWRLNKKGPKFHRVGERAVRYYLHEVHEWLAACDEPR